MQLEYAAAEALGSVKPAALRSRLRLAAAKLAGGLAFTALAAGCAQIRPYVPPSEGHIATPAIKADADQGIPAPAKLSAFVPPPKPAVKAQTYSVVVNEVPVKDLLLALARDTKQNIDIHPALTGVVSLNAINETLPAILDRISRQVNLRYRMEGNTLIVGPDTAYIKTYMVNYVNIQRNTTSTTAASGQLAASGGAGAATGGNTSTMSVTTTSSSDFWKLLAEAVRAILKSSEQQALSAEAKSERMQILRQDQEQKTRQLEAASKTGQAAPAIAASINVSAASTVTSALLPEDVIINPVAGTITVNGNEKQHQLIQDYLTKVENGAQRQVLIEATIIEVQLSNAYQGGIDWSRLAISGGINVTQTLLTGFAGAAQQAGAAAGNAITIGYQNPTSRLGNISAAVKLLEEFGNTRVLSSPKLMVLNNQTAILKAVDNLVYFEIQASPGVVTAGGVITPPTFSTTPKTVAVGIVMGVTPQVNDDGRVLLTVRPTVSRALTPVQDPNPSLCDNSIPRNCIASLIPQIQVREMESVLQVNSGQAVVLGGLMQDNTQFNREQVPVLGNVPDIGELFRFRNERAQKSELIIFLRPTVITNPTLESEELRFFQRFLPQANQQSADKPGAR
jgi:MSHA type pilus biogenesis protein MshL